ncbi:myelin-oligodendrocyte glycoprotein-like [Labrus mixtus]|uniref:myelin-oligodendrocyte glycoprotein-like n=1 Tax=Labrus mixtus TaxID=508554 RepID=UPI0029C05459|nr:myelin-oligodendrocyte glycoprotein-like [Labrus mixtus]
MPLQTADEDVIDTALSTFVICLFQVIGSVPQIVAFPGDDVILPCVVEPPISILGLTVEWSRPNQQCDPDDRPGTVRYVHLYWDSRKVQDMMLSSYLQRAKLSKNGLSRGNISLKIMKVTLDDDGRYKCFIPQLKGKRKSSTVRLVVVDKNW